MVAASRAKASDRAALLKKLFPLIKKHYKVQIAKGGKPVLETMLYSICLEDSTVDEAEQSYKRLFTDFPDLNEVRVSTVGEIEAAFEGQAAGEWRAYRVISALKFVFDKNYAFELEGLRKKTLDLATKQLSKIKELSQFVRDYTLHEVTGAHMIPLDTSSARLLVWLGMALPNQTPEQISEMLKATVRKAEVEAFTYTIRALATDKKIQIAFDATKYPVPEGGHDLDTAMDRLTELIKHGPEKLAKPSAPKAAPVKKVATKTETKAAAAPVKAATKTSKKAAAPAKPADKKVTAAKKPTKKGR